MEEIKNTEIQEEEVELTHTDKLLGIFTNPAGITKQMSKFPAKISDWLIPLLIYIFLIPAMAYLFISVPKLRQITIESQMEIVQQMLDDAVQRGELTQEMADQRLEMTYEYMQTGIEKGIGLQLLYQVASVLVGFLLLSSLLFGVSKLFKAEGSYLNSLTAFGLPFYISIFQIIVMVIVALIANKTYTNFGITEFIKADPTKLEGLLLMKLNIFSIWFYIVVGIGFKNLMKMKSYVVSIGMVIGTWLIFIVAFYYLTQLIPYVAYIAYMF